MEDNSYAWLLVLSLMILMGIVMWRVTNGRTYESEHSYFTNTIKVEYSQQKLALQDDPGQLDVTIYQSGEYTLGFSTTPGKDASGEMLDERVVSVSKSELPYQFMIPSEAMPDFLRVTITHDGQAEYHDFE